MRLVEILAEASEHEKSRRAKLRAQSKRAAANEPDTVPVKKKGIPSNVPPKSHYITNPPLKQQKDQPGIFDDPRFAEFREPKVDPKENKGVMLRFHVEKHPNTGNPILFGFWAHDYAPDFTDAKKMNSARAIGELYSHITIDLIKELIAKEHAVNILIDPAISKQFPSDVKKLGRWATSKKSELEFNGLLNFEINKPTQNNNVVAPLTIPAAELRIPNVAALESQLMAKIRNDSQIMAQYKEADEATRAKALKAGVISLHKFKDIDDAVDEVRALL